MTTTAYSTLKKELHEELLNVLDYWEKYTLDTQYGGFVGKIDHSNHMVPKSSKGIILNTRILWSFSAASLYLKTEKYQAICDRAYEYLSTFFMDADYNGLYWELDYLGNPINKRKQVYAQAFGIYAFSEYYLFSKKEVAKNKAIELFHLLEKHAKDPIKQGYVEAFNQDWSPVQDMRLSEKDMNASKTMNTHLHVLEAYTSLLKIQEDANLKNSLIELIELFLNKFLNENHHFDLFFDNNWNLLSNSVSYGHDIEAAWLLIEAAKAVKDESLVRQTKALAVKVANTFLEEGIDAEGAVLNEMNYTTGHLDTDRHWWPQVEALIGLNYAYQIKKDTHYLDASVRIWEFVKNHFIDQHYGEWFFRIDKNGNVYTTEDKVSMWKAPYHTSRAFIQLNKKHEL